MPAASASSCVWQAFSSAMYHQAAASTVGPAVRMPWFFRMAPLHHHFELIGWSEPKVIARFVIVGIIFALFSLTTLKLR